MNDTEKAIDTLNVLHGCATLSSVPKERLDYMRDFLALQISKWKSVEDHAISVANENCELQERIAFLEEQLTIRNDT